MKIEEKIARVIEDNTITTKGEYSPLAGPITSDKTELRISPKKLADKILQLFEEEKRELFRLIEDEEPNAFARLYPKLSRYLKGE